MNFDVKTKIIREILDAEENRLTVIKKSDKTNYDTVRKTLPEAKEGYCPECGSRILHPSDSPSACGSCGYEPSLSPVETMLSFTRAEREERELNYRDFEEDIRTNL